MVRFTAAPPTLGQVTEIQVALVWVGITSHSFISERRAEIGAQKEKEPDSQVPSRQAGLLWEGFPGGGTLGHFGWALASTRDSPVLRGPVGGFSLSLLSARVAVTSLSPRDPGGPTLSLGPLEVWLGGCRQLAPECPDGHRTWTQAVGSLGSLAQEQAYRKCPQQSPGPQPRLSNTAY